MIMMIFGFQQLQLSDVPVQAGRLKGLTEFASTELHDAIAKHLAQSISRKLHIPFKTSATWHGSLWFYTLPKDVRIFQDALMAIRDANVNILAINPPLDYNDDFSLPPCYQIWEDGHLNQANGISVVRGQEIIHLVMNTHDYKNFKVVSPLSLVGIGKRTYTVGRLIEDLAFDVFVGPGPLGATQTLYHFQILPKNRVVFVGKVSDGPAPLIKG
jgi:hypothetical protein